MANSVCDSFYGSPGSVSTYCWPIPMESAQMSQTFMTELISISSDEVHKMYSATQNSRLKYLDTVEILPLKNGINGIFFPLFFTGNIN